MYGRCKQSGDVPVTAKRATLVENEKKAHAHTRTQYIFLPPGKSAAAEHNNDTAILLLSTRGNRHVVTRPSAVCRSPRVLVRNAPTSQFGRAANDRAAYGRPLSSHA
ncbi:unnamed protein product, partial [Iphiclides podalirius]